jgi:hypothetical protein
MHPEGPATGHLNTGFLVFEQLLRWLPSSKLIVHASNATLPILNSSKLSLVLDDAKLLACRLCNQKFGFKDFIMMHVLELCPQSYTRKYLQVGDSYEPIQ